MIYVLTNFVVGKFLIQRYLFVSSRSLPSACCPSRMRSNGCLKHQQSLFAWQHRAVRSEDCQHSARQSAGVLLCQLRLRSQRSGAETGSDPYWSPRCDHIGTVSVLHVLRMWGSFFQKHLTSEIFLGCIDWCLDKSVDIFWSSELFFPGSSSG